MGTWQVSDYRGGWKILSGTRNGDFLAMVCTSSTSFSSALSRSLTFSSSTNGEILLSWRPTINKYSWIGIPNERWENGLVIVVFIMPLKTVKSDWKVSGVSELSSHSTVFPPFAVFSYKIWPILEISFKISKLQKLTGGILQWLVQSKPNKEATDDAIVILTNESLLEGSVSQRELTLTSVTSGSLRFLLTLHLNAWILPALQRGASALLTVSPAQSLHKSERKVMSFHLLSLCSELLMLLRDKMRLFTCARGFIFSPVVTTLRTL